jgi:FAD/FMN-containing dehydrogenase
VSAAAADVDPSATKAQFGDNYERLQMLKQKFDPELIFNKWYPIVPAA